MNIIEYSNPIIKAAKGWMASEMNTWSDDKKKLILQQYGKTGLTPNTYAWLTARVGNTSTALTKKTTAQTTSGPRRSTADALTYMLTYDNPTNKDWGLSYLATSIGTQGAYDPKKSNELVKADMTVQEKKNASAKVAAQAQQQKDYKYAIQNYEKMTGNKFVEGVTSLNGYTRDDVRRLQAQYGLTTLDGIWGTTTADAKARYDQDKAEAERIQNTKIDTSKISSDTTHTSFNDPALTLAKDLITAKVNNVYRTIKGDDQATLIKPATVTNVPDNLKEVMRRLIIQLGAGDHGGIDEAAWKRYQGTYTGGERSMYEREFDPTSLVEHTLGQFGWKNDPETGHIIAYDTYDFNTGEGTKGLGWYSKVRDYAGEYGSRDTDPDEGKRHYAIDLGSVDEWRQAGYLSKGGNMNYFNYSK